MSLIEKLKDAASDTNVKILGSIGTLYSWVGSYFYHNRIAGEERLPKIIDSFCPPGSFESNYLFTPNTLNYPHGYPLNYVLGAILNAIFWGGISGAAGIGIKHIREIKNKALRYALLASLALGTAAGLTSSYINNYQANTRLEKRVERDKARLIETYQKQDNPPENKNVH